MGDVTFPPLCPWQPTGNEDVARKNHLRGTAEGTPVSAEKSDSDLKKACTSMEAQFVYYLFKEMRKSVPENGFIPKGSAEKMYTSMLDLQMAEELSQNGGVGLAPLLYRQLTEDIEQPESLDAKKGEK